MSSQAQTPYKVFQTPDSGEMQADPDGNPRCPDCGGQVIKCGIDIYRCRKCGEGWTMTPCPPNTEPTHSERKHEQQT